MDDLQKIKLEFSNLVQSTGIFHNRKQINHVLEQNKGDEDKRQSIKKYYLEYLMNIYLNLQINQTLISKYDSDIVKHQHMVQEIVSNKSLPHVIQYNSYNQQINLSLPQDLILKHFTTAKSIEFLKQPQLQNRKKPQKPLIILTEMQLEIINQRKNNLLKGTNVQVENMPNININNEEEKKQNTNIKQDNEQQNVPDQKQQQMQQKNKKIKELNQEHIIFLKQNKNFGFTSIQKLAEIVKTAKENDLICDEDTNKIPESNQDQEDDYKVYNMRFFVCILYYLSDFCNSLQSATFTTIAAILVQIYETRPILINMTSLVQFIILPLVTPYANNIIDKFGMGTSVRIGVVFSLIGCWMRIFLDEFFPIIILGSVLNAFGGPFVFNAKTKIAANWFRPKVWPKVTTFISYSVLINSICGIIVPGIWFTNYDVDIDKLTNYKQGKRLVYQLLLFYAIIISMLALLILVFLKDKPPTPPSFTATVKREEDIKIATKELLRNSNYMKLLFGLSLAFGSFTGLIVTVSFLVLPFGFNQSDTSYMIAIVPVTATIGVLAGQKILVQQKNYRLFIACCFTLHALITQCLIFMMEAGKLWVNIIAMAALGFVAIPSVPAGYEYASELAFPIGEGSAIGYVLGIAGINGFVFGLIFSEIIQGQSKLQSYIGIMVLDLMFLTSVSFILWTKLDNKRTNVEKQRSVILGHQPLRSFGVGKSSRQSLSLRSKNSLQNSSVMRSLQQSSIQKKTQNYNSLQESALHQLNGTQPLRNKSEIQQFNQGVSINLNEKFESEGGQIKYEEPQTKQLQQNQQKNNGQEYIIELTDQQFLQQ